MKLPRRRFLHLIAGTAALPAVSRLAMAQTYPTRPVRIMVGFAAGGTADIMARLMGQWLSERLGQQFVVENRTAGYEASSVWGLGAPRNTPAEIVDKLNKAVNETLAVPRSRRGSPTWAAPCFPARLLTSVSSSRMKRRSGVRW